MTLYFFLRPIFLTFILLFFSIYLPEVIFTLLKHSNFSKRKTKLFGLFFLFCAPFVFNGIKNYDDFIKILILLFSIIILSTFFIIFLGKILSVSTTKIFYSFLIFVIIYSAGFLVISKTTIYSYDYISIHAFEKTTIEQLKNNKKAPLNNTIVNSLKKMFLPVYSWNTKYGRIYASVCSGPPYDAKYSNCLDGGTSFHDNDGKFITACGGGWGEKTPSICSAFFSKLKASDADYYSDSIN